MLHFKKCKAGDILYSVILTRLIAAHAMSISPHGPPAKAQRTWMASCFDVSLVWCPLPAQIESNDKRYDHCSLLGIISSPQVRTRFFFRDSPTHCHGAQLGHEMVMMWSAVSRITELLLFCCIWSNIGLGRQGRVWFCWRVKLKYILCLSPLTSAELKLQILVKLHRIHQIQLRNAVPGNTRRIRMCFGMIC